MAGSRPDAPARDADAPGARVGINPFTGQPIVYPERHPKSGPRPQPRATLQRPGDTTAGEKLIHLNQHEESDLPCLCRKCLRPEQTVVEVSGVVFHRQEARARRRLLYYWMPEALLKEQKQVRFSIENRMRAQLRPIR